VVLKNDPVKQLPGDASHSAAPLVYVLYEQKAHDVEPGSLANVLELHCVHELLPALLV
jgi:hypothetical protein